MEKSKTLDLISQIDTMREARTKLMEQLKNIVDQLVTLNDDISAKNLQLGTSVTEYERQVLTAKLNFITITDGLYLHEFSEFFRHAIEAYKITKVTPEELDKQLEEAHLTHSQAITIVTRQIIKDCIQSMGGM